MALTDMFSNFRMTVKTLCTVSFEAVPLGAIKHDGAEHVPCVTNSGSHLLLPEPWVVRALHILI